MEKPRILVVDDEMSIRTVLRGILKMKNCEVREAGSTEEALPLMDDWEPAVALVDIVLPGRNGLELLRETKEEHPNTEVVMMTSNSSASTALEAIREGANDYLKKPFALDEVWKVVQRAIEKRSLKLQNQAVLADWESKTRELSSALSLEDRGTGERDALLEVFEHYLEVITRELGADRASLMVFDEAGNELMIAASTGLEGLDTKEIRVVPGDGIAGAVAKTGQAILVPDVHTDDRTRGRVRDDLSGSFVSAPITLCVPVKNEREVLGVINLTNRRSGEPFVPKDATFVNSMASQLAVTIDAARQASQLQKAYKSVKAMQDQLVFTERIKAVGQMAAGVAHDFNNLMTVIMARAQFIRDMLDQEEPDRGRIIADVEAIIKTAWQGAETVKRIQDYTRIRKDLPTGAVDINDVIRDAVELSRPKWKGETDAKGVQVELKQNLAEVPQISGSPHELTQVITNLIFNAVEAMPDGGRIELSTRSSDDSVLVEVRDTGVGMDEAMQTRLFEPFFSSKEAGQGLGASIMYGIVTRHQGEIEVSSKLGGGTTFVVKLPQRQTPAVAEAEPISEPASESHKHRARILLIDDEQIVLETHEEVLSRGGHEIVSVADGHAALALLDTEEFDLVITDLSMEGLSGLDVARGVKAHDPTLPVILLSGWAMQQSEQRVQEAGVDLVLPKPCSIDELLKAVQQNVRVPAAV